MYFLTAWVLEVQLTQCECVLVSTDRERIAMFLINAHQSLLALAMVS